MSTCAIVGVNWGDEGKGRMVDLLASRYDIVVRYQGGSNAGHTVINEYGKFALNLIPSGIFRPGVVNILGNGTVVDLEHLCGEISRLRAAGISITPENLKISDRSIIVFPFHKEQDGLEEARLKDAKYGSTKRGIAPVYSDKYQKKGIQMGDLLLPDVLNKHLKTVLEWKNLMLSSMYGAAPYAYEDIINWLNTFGGELKPFITDTGAYLCEAHKKGKSILFEAQLGALRDIEFGIYPFTSSSSPLAAYAPLGAGVPGVRVDEVLGVVKGRPLRFGMVWPRGGSAARKRRGIWRRHRPPAPRRSVRRGGHPLRRARAGHYGYCAYQNGRALLYGANPSLRGL